MRRLNTKMKNLEIPVRKLQVIPQVLQGVNLFEKMSPEALEESEEENNFFEGGVGGVN